MSKEEMLEKLNGYINTLGIMSEELKSLGKIKMFNAPADNKYSSDSIRERLYSAEDRIYFAKISLELAIKTIETGRY